MTEPSRTPILGSPVATKEQATRWAFDKMVAQGHPAFVEGAIRSIVSLYWSFGADEVVRPDVALAQAVKETAAFNFTGAVRAGQWNFAGIGATGGGVPGESWPGPAEGIQGHLRRLRMYAAGSDAIYDLDILKRPLPRSYWGAAPYVEDLGGRWAPSPDYGLSIVRDYLAPLIATTPPSDWEEHWAAASIRKAVASGAMVGYEDGTFRPDEPVTRGELAAVLDRTGLIR